MRTGVILLTLLVSLCVLQVKSQQLNVENVFNSSTANNTQHGINAAYMFHHLLDEDYQLASQIQTELINTNFDVVRFPGGAIGNYYRLNGTGYGALRNEVQNVANTVNCNGTGAYCFTKDQLAPRNFIYDFLELMDAKYDATGKKTEVLYMLNLLLHFVYNYNQIQELETINDLDELAVALSQELISQNFYDRIIENYNAMSMVIGSSNLNLAGIEMGNEFYFYQEVTTFPYPITNSNPFFNLSGALNTIHPRITKYLTLINFYKRLILPLEPGVKIGVPIGGINHLGNQANADELWNTAIKQWVIQDVDALIPHLYIKTEAPEVDPPSVAADDDNSNLVAIKEGFEFSLETKFQGIISEIGQFFELDNDYRTLWMTEYNVNKNNSASQIWDEWTNTYLHGAFLQEMMNRMTIGDNSGLIEYSIQHGWSGGETSFEHCILSRKNDGSLIKRISYYNNQNSDFMKSANTVELEGNISHNQNSWDLYSDAFYTYSLDESDCPVERFILTFANLREDIIAANLNFNGNQITLNNKTYNIISSKLRGFQGQNVSSSCGRTEFNNNEASYAINPLEYDIDISSPINIPGYTTGHLDLIIQPVNLDCLPLGITNFGFNEIPLHVYPSPASDLIHVDLPDVLKNASAFLSITNIMGQVIREFNIIEDRPSIDIESLDSGIYFIRASNGSENSRAVSFLKL